MLKPSNIKTHDHFVNVVERVKLEGLATYVDIENQKWWENTADTLVFTLNPKKFTGKDFAKSLELLIALKPDEVNSMEVNKQIVWRFWWD